MNHSKFSTRDMAYCAIFAVVMAICSWISIPASVPFTLQTMGVFLSCIVLGGKRGTIAVTVFILLGCIGIPVFSGFTGGMGIILGSTGGYIIGFIFTGLIMWLFEHFFGNKTWSVILSMALGLVVCYAIGTVWFMVVYARSSGAVGLGAVLGWCVIPFILPDIAKMAVAFVVGKRVHGILVKNNLD